MKKPQTDREQSAALMWDWIWPAFVLLEGPFALFFIVLPNPNFPKALLAIALLGVHLVLVYNVRYRRQLARLWSLFGTMTFLNMACFIAGYAIVACFRFRWPRDLGYVLLFMGGVAGIAYWTWRYYTPLMKELLEADCRTGRFDLDRGTFSLLIPPSLYEFKTKVLRKATAILLPYSGVFIAIAAASGVHGGRKLLVGRDLGSGALSLFLAVMCVFAMTCAFYTYRWIRRWEKATGRTMWIKGFEPGLKAS